MLYSRHRFYLAPDTGGGNGDGENAPEADETKKADETEAMKKELVNHSQYSRQEKEKISSCS